jgi:hypothetical protein
MITCASPLKKFSPRAVVLATRDRLTQALLVLSLAERTSASFLGTIRERGMVYLAERRVRIVQSSPAEVRAEVEGTETYEVTLAIRGSRLATLCSCPYAQNDFCKHMWAVICACDRHGYLIDAGPSTTRVFLVLGGGGPEDALAEDDDRVLLVSLAAANDS